MKDTGEVNREVNSSARMTKIKLVICYFHRRESIAEIGRGTSTARGLEIDKVALVPRLNGCKNFVRESNMCSIIQYVRSF